MTDATPVRPGTRRALFLALRFAVAALGLGLAFRLALPSSDASAASAASVLAESWKAPTTEALGWFGLACLLLGISLAVGALRFRGLLEGAGLQVGLGLLLRSYIVATFFNLVLPGAMLGDVYRFWDARRDTGEGARVLGVVVLERVLSLAALGAVALAVAPALPSAVGDRRLLIGLVLVGAAFVLAALGVLLPPVNRALVVATRKLARLGSRVAPQLAPRLADGGERALAAVAGLAAQPRVIVRAFGWSLVNQGLPVVAVAVLAVPLDALVPWYWFAVIVPFVTLVSLLPVSVGGTGVRELLYVSLFGAVGMRPEAALALSLSILAAALVWGLVGLAIFAWGRRDGAGVANGEAPSAEA